MLWEHLTGGVDMFAVFDHVTKPGLGRAVSKKQVLKLVRHGELLDEIDLENLSFQVRLDEERYRSQQIQDSERYVVLVIKHPAVALRYQLSTGEVRRIQMNFRPESGYEVAVKVFRAIGVPISDKNISASASQSSNPRPTPNWNGQPVLRYPHFSEDSQMKNEFSQYSNTGYHAGPPELGTIPNFGNTSNGPAFAYRNILQQPPNGQYDSLESPNRGLTSTGSTGFLPSPSFPERATTSYNYPFPSSSAPEQHLARPATAPLTLTQLMPPRRELPFAREPASSAPVPNAQNEDDHPRITNFKQSPQKTAKQAQSPAKAKPKPKAQSARPSSSRTKPRPVSNRSTAKDHPVAAQTEIGPEAEPRPLTSPETVHAPTTSPVRETTTKEHILTEISPNKRTTRSKKTPSTATSTSTTTPLPKSNDPISNANPHSSDNETIPPSDYLNRLDTWIRKYHDLPTPASAHAPNPKSAALPLSTSKENLAAYAAQSEEERLEALDTMICKCLEDENFVKLVEDVERSWKRVGLGF
ncbi:MAG: hypothetical protein Q9166_005628 [cf. Caloplaca sp. 2 TL-2023]